jgi:outer membrane biosynthesis protein TonB
MSYPTQIAPLHFQYKTVFDALKMFLSDKTDDELSVMVLDFKTKKELLKPKKESTEPKVSKEPSKEPKVSKESKVSKEPKVSKVSKEPKDQKVSKEPVKTAKTPKAKPALKEPTDELQLEE